MAITRKEAAMIAEELYKKIKPEILSAVKDITKIETEEYYTPKDIARILGYNQYTVYKKKDLLGCYLKINNRLLFPKSKFHELLQSGRISSRV